MSTGASCSSPSRSTWRTSCCARRRGARSSRPPTRRGASAGGASSPPTSPAWGRTRSCRPAAATSSRSTWPTGRCRGAAYTTITSSLLAETLADTFIGPLCSFAAYASGRIPHLPALGHLAAFEWSFFASHAQLVRARRGGDPDPDSASSSPISSTTWCVLVTRQPGARDPADAAALLPHVSSLQVAGWCCRPARCTASSVRSVCRPTSIDADARALGPERIDIAAAHAGRAGTQQALLGYMFRNAARDEHGARVLVGMQFVVTLTSVLAGGSPSGSR